jgi:hypothetical protein
MGACRKVQTQVQFCLVHMLVCMTDWYRGFERHLGHRSEGFFFCLCCPLHVDVLRRANPSSNKTYQMPTKKIRASAALGRQLLLRRT